MPKRTCSSKTASIGKCWTFSLTFLWYWQRQHNSTCVLWCWKSTRCARQTHWRRFCFEVYVTSGKHSFYLLSLSFLALFSLVFIQLLNYGVVHKNKHSKRMRNWASKKKLLKNTLFAIIKHIFRSLRTFNVQMSTVYAVSIFFCRLKGDTHHFSSFILSFAWEISI